MMARLPHVSDNEVTQDEVKYLEKEGKDYCMAHGMVYKDSKGETQHIPFTLYPSPIPLQLFADAKDVQTDFNLLVHNVSQDYEFTKKALLSTVAADPFTSRLFDIYEKVWEQGTAQSISLGIFRSDYMIDTTGGLHDRCCSCYSSSNTPADSTYIKQVEMNTISLGGISFSCLVPDMHRYLLSSMGRENKVPPNPALDEAAAALLSAWELYGSDSAVIMFVVQPDEVNVYDQRLLEYRIHDRNNAVRVIRRSLKDIFTDSKMGNDKSIFVTGLEIGVAYFRAGYTPKDYPTDKEWSARLTLELSRCIKCPTVAHHLMGTKKIQQVLSDPGVLERFLPDHESVERVRKTFTGLYTLDPGPKGDHNMECCLRVVEKCVLKPQREGGGNNIYGEDIRRTLLANSDNRTQYILMDRISPQISKNFIVRQESTSIRPVDVIPELGIVGIFIRSCDRISVFGVPTISKERPKKPNLRNSRGDEVLVNKEGGYLVRTKTTEHADGGVFAGRASFDSPYMV